MKTLKKYPNRRIYDPDIGSFVKLEDIRQLVTDGVNFRIVHSKSKEDCTSQILLQIITDQESKGRRSLLTTRVLEELIRFYDDEMVALLQPYLEQQILAFLDHQKLVREQLGRAAAQPQSRALKEMGDRLLELLAQNKGKID